MCEHEVGQHVRKVGGEPEQKLIDTKTHDKELVFSMFYVGGIWELNIGYD